MRAGHERSQDAVPRSVRERRAWREPHRAHASDRRTVASGAVTYRVVSALASGRWSMAAPSGRAVAGGDTMQVRLAPGNVVFAGADVPALSAPVAGGSGAALAGRFVSGGTEGDDPATFEVTVPSGRSIGSAGVMTLRPGNFGSAMNVRSREDPYRASSSWSSSCSRTWRVSSRASS